MGYNGITVLVVEDEILLRMDIVQSLEEEGFRVFEAANADDAIAILTAQSEIHLMFTDIDMPGSMDGLKLAIAVRDRWPPIKIIVTSGHRHMIDSALPVPGRFFDKPYNASQIISVMREMVAAS
ncbi:transcriptional regulator [Rhizobium sp. Leaf391]|uniref:response regulator n=1 Tax=Rhizobium sp. Leaf391 TaxID=1736360 RepID=UPI000712A1F2|nr:response regulator [Rhizobium sp. Leaf391]KQT02803.1 transcriptional regulator [Rhizobium sp. Leaf391]